MQRDISVRFWVVVIGRCSGAGSSENPGPAWVMAWLGTQNSSNSAAGQNGFSMLHNDEGHCFIISFIISFHDLNCKNCKRYSTNSLQSDHFWAARKAAFRGKQARSDVSTIKMTKVRMKPKQHETAAASRIKHEISPAVFSCCCLMLFIIFYNYIRYTNIDYVYQWLRIDYSYLTHKLQYVPLILIPNSLSHGHLFQICMAWAWRPSELKSFHGIVTKTLPVCAGPQEMDPMDERLRTIRGAYYEGFLKLITKIRKLDAP